MDVTYHSEAVTDATRAKAQEWLNAFEAEVKRLGFPWAVPWVIEHLYDDGIDIQWDRLSLPQRWLHVTVWGEDEEEEPSDAIDYLRSESKDPTCEMLEGPCEDLETCRLLWLWLWN